MGFEIYNFPIKFVALFLLILVCGVDSADPLSKTFGNHVLRKQPKLLAQQIAYESHNYTQILDHFTFVSEGSRTFQQRYFVNKTYWGGPMSNSPIFVCLGGEGAIEDFIYGGCGIMIDNAPYFKALLLFIEV